MAHGIGEPTAANKIDYVEFQMIDVEAAKRFYGNVFGWTFTDYGEEYASFNCGNLTGGFAKTAAVKRGGVLIVLYAKDLQDTQRKIVDSGGVVVRETFSFPGGKRFHFTDPSGNELAVWSDQ